MTADADEGIGALTAQLSDELQNIFDVLVAKHGEANKWNTREASYNR
jgi:hypothetical protein